MHFILEFHNFNDYSLADKPSIPEIFRLNGAFNNSNIWAVIPTVVATVCWSVLCPTLIPQVKPKLIMITALTQNKLLTFM